MSLFFSFRKALLSSWCWTDTCCKLKCQNAMFLYTPTLDSQRAALRLHCQQCAGLRRRCSGTGRTLLSSRPKQAKFREMFRISAKFDEKCLEIAFLFQKMRRNLAQFWWSIEVWAVQKRVNLEISSRSFPTNIFLENLASIRKRTSPLKFDHLAEKSE